ncbi:MAG: EF-P beta-lysylation protein EpmB, partial [Methylococcaceae bacterium]|nr:EF-P beta-lysylation protein EpmB [Methylococcaceae bacterium]
MRPSSPSQPVVQPQWRNELAESFTSLAELLEFLELGGAVKSCRSADSDPSPSGERGARGAEPAGVRGDGSEGIAVVDSAATAFPLRVTRSYAARITKGDPADPLLLQVLPQVREASTVPGYGADPVGDRAAAAVPGLLHKYAGRVLLLATGACAIHCRYCFRREFPYGEFQLTRQREAEALAYIAADASIEEVILSGGDPLVLGDDRLASLIQALESIPHLSRLRIHSRLPVVLPSRITDGLLRILGGTRLQPVLVIHANHSRELAGDVAAALRGLSEAGVVLLNQSVLLKGVNDRVESLVELSKRLFSLGVQPYYLHLLDKAGGVAHFD